jgi:hypothetical protein
MPPHLPTTCQILAGIWLRLRILAPIIAPILAALWLAGIDLAGGTKIAAVLVVLTMLALDSARHPHGTRHGARQ